MIFWQKEETMDKKAVEKILYLIFFNTQIAILAQRFLKPRTVTARLQAH